MGRARLWIVRMPALLLASLLCTFSAAQAPGDSQARFSLMLAGQLPVPTQMHGAAIVGSRLYCMGGNIGAVYSNDVKSAVVGPDGRLSQWRQERPLPESRCYIMNAVEVINDRIYVIAGGTAPKGTNPSLLTMRRDILWTTVDKDGRLAEWKPSESFPGAPVANVASAASENFIYVTGGNDNNNISANVLLTEVRADGSPGPWRIAGEMPVPLWFHGATIQEKRMYLWGGLRTTENTSINNKVFSCELRSDGRIGEWRTETEMPHPIYSSAFRGFNDYLLCLGGRYVRGVATNVIWYTRLQDGRVTEWKMFNTDMETQIYHAAGMNTALSTVFVVGGRVKNAHIVGKVQAFRLPQPATEQLPTGAAGGFLKMPAALQAAQSTGKPVLLLIHSSQVPAAKRLWNRVVNTPEFRKATTGAVTALLDVATEGNEYCYKYSVFKIPAFVVLSPKGEVVNRLIRVDSVADVEKALAAAPQTK